MENEYLGYLKEDAKLYAAIEDKLPQLQNLSFTQVEKLVFYLKNLHSYYPKSENLATFHLEFADKLDELRRSSEQIAISRKAGIALMKGMACCVLAGILLATAIVLLLNGEKGIGLGLTIAVIACILYADGKLLHKALVLSKEQDRKYFLSSIRAANGCNELDWAGLFSYTQTAPPGPQRDAEVGDLTERLRAALYNDEYFQNSPAKLKSAASPGI